MKIAVLGTGISGLSIAQLLKQNHDVTVYEKKQEIGGLIKCERVQDCLFHQVGGHVFNSKNMAVSDWFWSFFDKDKEFIKAERKAKVYFSGSIIGYPIENYLYELPKENTKTILGELFDLQSKMSKHPFEYDNFEEFLKGNFGETLFRLYFEPYNKKIWRVDLKEVSMHWLEGKLPMPNFREMVLSNILKEEESQMVHASFYYPKNEGSQFIVNRLSEDVVIHRGFEAENIRTEGKKIVISNQEYDKVIYTGDIRRLPSSFTAYLKEAGVSLEKIAALRSNGTSNLFCETDPLDISWLYIPEDFTRAHRIIYTGNFSDSNNRGSSRKTCVVEFSGKLDIGEMAKEVKKLPGNLNPLASNYEANSYVIQNKWTRPLIQQAREVLENQNVYLLGRFAEWEYYNMDKAIEAAMKLSKRI
jgi:protoporphyrinogen oxidase